jgi:ubiquinone/menaquinone biosynthesis C-methylase UbiE
MPVIKPNTSTTIGADTYSAWRAASLGAITEAIERRLVLDLMGDVTGAQLLEIGCGDGGLLCQAVMRGAEATRSIPIQRCYRLRGCVRQRQEIRATFLSGRLERLPLANASFHVVTSVTVRCFVSDALGALREMARVLRPGGRLEIGELGRWSAWAAIRSMRGWLGSATWRAARFRAASELRSLRETAGLSVTAIRGAVFYPPVAFLARALAPIDLRLGNLTTVGAAFIALLAASANQARIA